MDDAGGGQRGLRAASSVELEELLRRSWSVRPLGPDSDLGGSSNLNLLVGDGLTRYVARVYRPFVTAERLAVIQAVRRRLSDGGLPVVESIPTLEGHPWSVLDDRLVEVEPFVASTGRMHDMTSVTAGLQLLGRIHAIVGNGEMRDQSTRPQFANCLAIEDAITSVRRGTNRIRGWNPTRIEADLADTADWIAQQLVELESRIEGGRQAQFAHGDYWDNNVLFDKGRVVLITDFDFSGCRPRVDDISLTLYFVSLDITDLIEDQEPLDALIRAYDSGAEEPLSEEERRRLPLAMARQALWSIGVWVALLDDEAAARRHLAGSARALRWSRRLTGTLAAGRA